MLVNIEIRLAKDLRITYSWTSLAQPSSPSSVDTSGVMRGEGPRANVMDRDLESDRDMEHESDTDCPLINKSTIKHFEWFESNN